MDSVIGDAELSGVLVLAGTANDNLETVVGDIGFEAGRGSPDECTSVCNVVCQASYRLNIRRRATKKHDRDSAGGCGLRTGQSAEPLDRFLETYGPGNGERCSSRDDLVQRRMDRISNWIIANGFGGASLSSSKARQRGRDNGSNGEFHFRSTVLV